MLVICFQSEKEVLVLAIHRSLLGLYFSGIPLVLGMLKVMLSLLLCNVHFPMRWQLFTQWAALFGRYSYSLLWHCPMDVVVLHMNLKTGNLQLELHHFAGIC